MPTSLIAVKLFPNVNRIMSKTASTARDETAMRTVFMTRSLSVLPTLPRPC